MRKSFLKTIVATAVVGATMALSSVVAWAAAGTYTADFSADYASTNLSYTTDTSGNTKTSLDATNTEYKIDNDGYFKISLSNKNRSILTNNNQKGIQFGSTSDYITFTTESKGATLKITCSSNNTKNARTVTITNVESIVTEKSMAPTEYTKTTGAKGKILIKGQNAVIYKIEVIEGEPDADPENYYTVSGQVTLNNNPVIGAVVTISGSNYVTNTTSTTDESGNYSFSNIGEDEIINLSIPSSDNYFAYTSENITVTTNKTQNIALTPVPTVSNITSNVFLKANDIDDGQYPNNSVIGNYFKVICDSDKYLEVDSGATASYGGVDYTKRISTKGAGRDLQFTIEEPAYIRIVMSAGDTGRHISIKSNDSDIIAPVEASKGRANILSGCLDAGTYIIHPDQNINIFAISVILGMDINSANHKAIYIDNAGAAYLVVGISADDFADTTKTQVAIYKVNNGVQEATPKKTSTKVYTGIKTGDNVELSPSEIGSAYVYGVKVTNGTGLTLDDFSGSVE